MSEHIPEPEITPCLANLPEMIRRKLLESEPATTARWARKSGGQLVGAAARVIDVKYSTLYRAANGIGTPSLDTLRKICAWGEWSLDEVLGIKKAESECDTHSRN